MFFPVPPMSLCLAKAIGKVNHTDGIIVVPFKISHLKKDRDEWVPQPCPSDAGIGMDLPVMSHMVWHLLICNYPNPTRKHQPNKLH